MQYRSRHITSKLFIWALLLLTIHDVFGQTRQGESVMLRGKVFEYVEGSLMPLQHASLTISTYGLSTLSGKDGIYSLSQIPLGKVSISVSYIGKVAIDTIVDIQGDGNIDFVLRENTLRIDQVDVTAKITNKNAGTSSVISQQAIEHLQANSLADVMSLLPGGLTSNPNLHNAKQINIRHIANSATNGSAINNADAFGVSIVVNGSPISNNANLQSLNPVQTGGTSSLSGGAAPNGGFDVRNIPLQNIESVEVIRGVPSVKYGDVVSGTVVVNQKAGRQPLIIDARTNPNLYALSASTGILFGEQSGALNVGADYSYNTPDPVQSYQFFQRKTLNTLYSNQFLGGRLTTNLGLSLHYGKDTQKLNPDDEITKTKSDGRDMGINLTSQGRLNIVNKWLKSIDYAARLSMVDKKSFYQQQYTAANAPYSMTYTDGAVLTNFSGRKFFDGEDHEITNVPLGEEQLYAVYLPSTYLGQYNIRGKEYNWFLQGSASFFNKIGNTNHHWVVGADFKSDRNRGEGKNFSDTLPPYRNLSYVNATFRKRTYSDIPALNQLGAYIEDNFSADLGRHSLQVTAGLRFDHFKGNKNVLSPRINADIEVIPEWLNLRGAYGLLAKSPSLLYISPENAYFEYVNVNETATTSIPEEDRVFMTTTRVFNTTNDDLKIARNEKIELGLDLKVGKSLLRITGFQEKLKDGYDYGPTTQSFRTADYIEYERIDDDAPIYAGTHNTVLAKFNMPNNSRRLDKKGIEFELFLKRFDAIRTQFVLNGSYIRLKNYSSDYVFYDGQSGTGAADRTHIGLYSPDMTISYEKSAVTSLRTVHNIPKIGFVVTLTTEFIWNESDWTVYGNDSIPVKYISKLDGQVYDFDKNRKEEDEFSTLLRPVGRTLETVESLPALVNFNLNVSKEIKDFLKVSFFANNMFRSYPVAQSDRNQTSYFSRNIPFFFGLNVGLKLK